MTAGRTGGGRGTTRSLWHLLAAIDVTLLLLLALTVPFIRPGTASHALVVASAALLGVTLAALGVVIYVGWRPFFG